MIQFMERATDIIFATEIEKYAFSMVSVFNQGHPRNSRIESLFESLGVFESV